MEFFHACLRKSAFAISSSYLFNTSDNCQRSSGFLSCGSFPAILTTCCKVSWPELTMKHEVGLQFNANTLTKHQGILPTKKPAIRGCVLTVLVLSL